MSRCRILLVTDLDSYLTSNTGQWDRTPTLKLMVPQPSDTFPTSSLCELIIIKSVSLLPQN